MPRHASFRLAILAALLAGAVPGAPATAADGVWTATLPATGGFDNLSAFPDGTAYASVGVTVMQDGALLPDGVPKLRSDSVGFFRSGDFGQTWAPVAPPPTPYAGSTNVYVRFATPKIGYVTTGARTGMPPDPTGRIDRTLCKQLAATYRTADGGATWQPICEPYLRNGSPIEVAPSPLAVGPDGKTVLLSAQETVGVDENECGIAQGTMYTSTDGGERWTRGTLPRHYAPGWVVRAYDRRTALVVAYRYRNDPDCTAHGVSNAVFLTNDSGRTWRKVYECAKQPVCTAAAFVTRNRLIVGKTDGSTAWTTDGGRRWRSGQPLQDLANEPGQAADPEKRWWHWVQSFSFTGNGTGYASTRGAGSWRSTDGGLTWTQERSHECVYYPWGVGENAAATPDRAVTGGPSFFSTRVPSPAPAGPCTPPREQPPVPADGIAVTAGRYAVGLDGTLTFR